MITKPSAKTLLWKDAWASVRNPQPGQLVQLGDGVLIAQTCDNTYEQQLKTGYYRSRLRLLALADGAAHWTIDNPAELARQIRVTSELIAWLSHWATIHRLTFDGVELDVTEPFSEVTVYTELAGTTLYALKHGDEGVLLKLDLVTDAREWSIEPDLTPRGAPQTAGCRVLVAGEGFPLDDEELDPAIRPRLDPDQYTTQLDAYDTADGTLAWRHYQDGFPLGVLPVGDAAVSFSRSSMFLLHATTGEIIRELPSLGMSARSAIEAGDAIIGPVGDAEEGVQAIAQVRLNGDLGWRAEIPGEQVQLYRHGEQLLVLSSTGELHALALPTGAQQWTLKLGKAFTSRNSAGEILVAGDQLVVAQGRSIACYSI